MKIHNIFKARVVVPFVTMADIAFLLLIFLIITSSIRKTQAPKLSLPDSEQFEKISQKENLELNIYDNSIFLQGRAYKLQELAAALPASSSCIINADRDMDFKFVYRVMETLKKQKFGKISFSVRRKAKP